MFEQNTMTHFLHDYCYLNVETSSP